MSSQRWWVATFPGHRALRGGDGPALAVETLAGASPPGAGEGDLEVVFDGLLHNRQELAALGGCRSEASAAEVVLATYRRLGAEAARALTGRFAALIWDGHRHELLCLRDPLGCYPLFFAARGEELLLSTGIEELLKQPGVSRALDRAVMAEDLCLRFTRPEDTHYAAVRRVPPGHVMAVGEEGRRSTRYWDPVPTPDSDDWIPEDELERFDQLFEQAVGRCLGSGQAGIYLSGGLDSVSVAAVAADLSRARGAPPPLALSIALPADYSEATVQRSVAAQLGMPQVMVDYDAAVDPPGRLAAALEASAGAPLPLPSIWVPAYWHVAGEGTRRGCEAILTGGGGDEMLVASPSLAADLIRRGDARGLWSLFKSLRRSFPWSTPELVWGLLWTTGARMVVVQAARKALGTVAPSVLRRRWERQIAAGTPSWVRPEEDLRRELVERGMRMASRPTRLSNFYYEDNRAQLDHVAATLEAENAFEEGRRLGVPVLGPFRDAELQEFLYRVPPLMLHAGGNTKSLVREMLGRRFPELGFERQKKRLADELANEVMAAEGPRLLEEMGGTRTLAELRLVDQAALKEWVSRMVSEPRERRKSYLLFRVIALEAWVRSRA